MIVSDGPVNYTHPRLIADFAARQKIPALYYRREFVEAGGLVSYGANYDDLFGRLADWGARYLKARTGDLPFELPTKLELVINLRAAKALGITVPQSLMLRADELIE